MLALAEYRRPRRKSFTAIRQANIAEQQIVTPRRFLCCSGRRRKNANIT